MAVTINTTEYLSSAEAAEELKTTIPRVLMLLRENALEGTLLDGEWYVAKNSVACGKGRDREVNTIKGCASHCSSGGCGCR